MRFRLAGLRCAFARRGYLHDPEERMCFALTLEVLERRIGLQAERVAAAAALLHKRTQRCRALLPRHFDHADPLNRVPLVNVAEPLARRLLKT
jgi:hypothetical protein